MFGSNTIMISNKHSTWADKKVGGVSAFQYIKRQHYLFFRASKARSENWDWDAATKLHKQNVLTFR